MRSIHWFSQHPAGHTEFLAEDKDCLPGVVQYEAMPRLLWKEVVSVKYEAERRAEKTELPSLSNDAESRTVSSRTVETVTNTVMRFWKPSSRVKLLL